MAIDQNLYRAIKRLEDFPLIHPEAKKVLVSTSFFQKVWDSTKNNDSQSEAFISDMLMFTDFFINFSEITAFTFDPDLLKIFDNVDKKINDVLNLYPEKKPHTLIKNLIDQLPEMIKYLTARSQEMATIKKYSENQKLSTAAPHVKTIIENFPDTEYAQSYDLFLKDFHKYYKLFNNELSCLDFSQPLAQLFMSLKKLFKYYELTRNHEERLYLPAEKKHYLHDSFLSSCDPEHYVTKINLWYYGIQGVLLYKDFDTKASLSPELSSADAVNFAKKLKSQSKPLNVLECGIGNGQFGIDFLNKLKKDYPDIYKDTIYNYCDFSQKLLDQVSDRKELKEHEGKTTYTEMNFLKFSYPGKLPYMRYHELFDDVPKNQIIYKDKSGKLYELLWRFFIKNPTSQDIEIVNDLEKNGVKTEFADKINTMLQKVSWEYQIEELAPENHKYFDLLTKSTKTKDDDFYIFNYGVIDTVDNLDQYIEKDGILVSFDYGFYKPQPVGINSKYNNASFINRNFGASITNDVNYDALQEWAEENGYKSKVWAQEDYIEEHLGYFVVSGASFSSFKRLYRHSNFTRTMFGENNYINDTVLDNNSSYEEYLTNLKGTGLLNSNLSYPEDESLSNIENLKINNDFYVCNIFKRYNLKFLYGDIGGAWLSKQIPVIKENLCKLGFKDDMFEKEKTNRDYCSLWVVEMQK